MSISSYCYHYKQHKQKYSHLHLCLLIYVLHCRLQGNACKTSVNYLQIYNCLPKCLVTAVAPSHRGAKNSQPLPWGNSVQIFKRLAILILHPTTFLTALQTTTFFCGLGDSLWFEDFSLLPLPFTTMLTQSTQLTSAFEGEGSRLGVQVYWMRFQLHF